MQTRMFFDMEFTGLHQNTTLMSIGIVSELGPSFYAELIDYDKDQVDDWLQENVIDNFSFNAPITSGNDYIFNQTYKPLTQEDRFKIHALMPSVSGEEAEEYVDMALSELSNVASVSMRGTSARLKKELTAWLEQFTSFEIKMISDCLSYDWVLFNQIFGHAFNIPEHINYIPYDICSGFEDLGIDPDISREAYVGSNGIDIPKGAKHNSLYDANIIRLCYYIQKQIPIML